MKPEQKHNERKKELFSMVRNLISQNGYENLTVRGICQELGISTGTFYHYFPNKNDLAWILFIDIDTYFTDEVTSNFTDDEVANLVNYAIAYATYVINGGVETCRCINIEPLKKLDHNYLDEDRGIFQVLLKILQRGVDKKHFHAEINPLETARMLMVLLRGYSSDWAKRNGNYDLTEKIETFINLFSKCLISN